jgi:hypothetical protein
LEKKAHKRREEKRPMKIKYLQLQKDGSTSNLWVKKSKTLKQTEHHEEHLEGEKHGRRRAPGGGLNMEDEEHLEGIGAS